MLLMDILVFLIYNKSYFRIPVIKQNKKIETKLKNTIFLEEKNGVLVWRKLISVTGTLSAGTARACILERRAIPAGVDLHLNQF